MILRTALRESGRGPDRQEPAPAAGPRAQGGRRARIGFVLLVAVAGLWLLAATRVYVNASWSDKAWGYVSLPLFGGDPAMGERVLFDPPGPVNAPVPYLKTVRGLPGSMVTVSSGRTVRIDGTAVGRAKTHALDGRALAAVEPGRIPPGRYFLHADHPDSYDSRYAEIGLVPRSRILGRAVALPDLPLIGLEGPLVGPEDVKTKMPPEARR